MKPADKTSWLKTAFTTADKDKDKAVSLTELTDYLTAQG
jgi:Ca2+-binding EF-hand superfamily protein